MKVTASKEAEKFKPVTLTLVFESQKELDTYGKLFNWAQMERAFRDLGVEYPDFRTLKEVGANITGASKIEAALMNTPYMKVRYADTYNP